MSEYIPYGPEWRSEIGRMRKESIIDMLAETAKERDSYRSRFDSMYFLNRELMKEERALCSPIRIYTANGHLVGLTEAAKRIGEDRSYVSRVLRGKLRDRKRIVQRLAEVNVLVVRKGGEENAG